MIDIVGCRNIFVFGLGVTGRSVLNAATSSGGLSVFAWDDYELTLATAREEYEGRGVAFSPVECVDWGNIDTLVLSPGIVLDYPEPHRVVKLARNGGQCRIIGDIELLWRARSGRSKLIAISGSNGKSTTTKLIHDILARASMKVQMCGNIGHPVLLCDADNDAYVIEISSFQLDLLLDARFDYSVLLNVTPDHLDRYPDIGCYAQSKMQVLNRSAFGVIGVDSEITRDMHSKHPSRWMPVSSRVELADGRCAYFTDGGRLLIAAGFGDEIIRIDLGSRVQLLGRHNEENICTAVAIALAMGVDKAIIRDAILNFIPLPHRMQYVGSTANIAFINDSKATNPDSVQYALSSLQERNKDVFLILGGKEKYPGSLQSIRDCLGGICGAYLVGSSTDDFYEYMKDLIPSVHKCYDMDIALQKAYGEALARGGDSVVILSPACASFDQWKNFEKRGEAFVGMVEALIQQTVVSG